MIMTITLNPAMDKTLTLEEFHVGGVNRVISMRNDIGGKGINVSKVLRAMGTDSDASGFLGGGLEEVFRAELRELSIQDHFITISGHTRTNTKIVDLSCDVITDINESGPRVTRKELDEFLVLYDRLLNKNDVVVLSGGLPPGVPVDVYGLLTRMARTKGARVVLDAEGEPLFHAMKEAPFMIKPNEKELAGLTGRGTLSEEEIIFEAGKLISLGIGKVLISRGEKGSILVTEGQILLAKGLKVPVRSTVGAGDAMVAAMVHAMEKDLDDFELLALAQAAGAAAVMTEGTKACSLEEIQGHLDEAASKIRKYR